MFFAAFFWHGSIGVDFLQALIAAVDEGKTPWMQLDAGGFEQAKVVATAFLIGRTDHLASADYDLRFLDVPLFLAGVITLLFFFGRSQGLSVASIITTS